MSLGYIKLQNLMDKPKSLYQLYATSAAYAGYGKGLCRTYIDAYACEREESELPNQRVLHLDLDSENMSGTLKTLRSAYGGSVDASFVDPGLGFEREEGRLVTAGEVDDASEQYWTIVSGRARGACQLSAASLYAACDSASIVRSLCYEQAFPRGHPYRFSRCWC